MAGEKVGGDISHLESFLHEAGCLPGKEAEKKFSSTRAFSDDSDFDVEEEFPSRRGAAKPTPGRGRGGRGGGRNSKGTSAVKPVQPKKVRPVAEVKKNVTTRPFIEASGKPVCEDTQSEEGEGDSGDSTQSENEGEKRGGKGKAGRRVKRRPVDLEQDAEYSTCDELNLLDDSDYNSCDEVEQPTRVLPPSPEAEPKSAGNVATSKKSTGANRLAAQAQLIAEFRNKRGMQCDEAMEEEQEVLAVQWNPYTPFESGDSTVPTIDQPTFGWTRDKKKEGDFLGYGRRTVPSEVVDHTDTEFEIWQKVVRPDIVVHEWVQATNYRANQWLKDGRRNAEEDGAHPEYEMEEGDNIAKKKLYGLVWVDVTFWEMMIWILLSFMMVAIGLPQEGDYWTPVAVAMFPAFNFHYFSDMTYRRYKQIKRFFCCQPIKKEDLESEGPRKNKPKDKLHRLRPFINHLNRMFLLLVICGLRWSIDESMIPYYGRYCPIKVYMKDKPDKFGMKVWGINDPDSGFLLQFKVYEGRGDRFQGETDSWCDIWSLGERVVLAFLRCIPKGSFVFTDRFFTTPMLAAYMYIVCGIYLTGTVMKNKLGVDTSLLMKQSSKLARGFFKWSVDFQNHVAQVCWFDRSIVFLCSSIHAIRSTVGVMRLTWSEEEGYVTKPMQAPEMALEYNGGMFGTDRGIETSSAVVVLARETLLQKDGNFDCFGV